MLNLPPALMAQAHHPPHYTNKFGCDLGVALQFLLFSEAVLMEP